MSSSRMAIENGPDALYEMDLAAPPSTFLLSEKQYLKSHSFLDQESCFWKRYKILATFAIIGNVASLIVLTMSFADRHWVYIQMLNSNADHPYKQQMEAENLLYHSGLVVGCLRYYRYNLSRCTPAFSLFSTFCSYIFMMLYFVSISSLLFSVAFLTTAYKKKFFLVHSIVLQMFSVMSMMTVLTGFAISVATSDRAVNVLIPDFARKLNPDNTQRVPSVMRIAKGFHLATGGLLSEFTCLIVVTVVYHRIKKL